MSQTLEEVLEKVRIEWEQFADSSKWNGVCLADFQAVSVREWLEREGKRRIVSRIGKEEIWDRKINKLLTEKVMNECWHTRTDEPAYEPHGTWIVVCKKCGKSLWLTRPNDILNPDFLKNPVDWHRLLVKAMKKKWWRDFAYKRISIGKNEFGRQEWSDSYFREELLNPLPVLGTEIYKILNKEEKE